MTSTEYFLKRQCRGLVRRTHRFLWWRWETEAYEYNPELFGAYYIGPFDNVALAADWPLYKRTDELVSVNDMHPDLVACLREGREHGGHREQYFGVDELADPTALLGRLRAIWA